MATAKTHPDNDPIAGEDSKGQVYWFYQCTSPLCNLRFPAPLMDSITCPFCKSTVEKITAAENYVSRQTENLSLTRKIAVLLDNIRSAYNVGSILRTSDGAGITHAYLCGITPTPENSRLAKTALTAEINTKWSHYNNAVDLVSSLKQTGHQIIGLEITPDAEDIFEANIPLSNQAVLIVGNEISGIDPAIIQQCDYILKLPMRGKKGSLNVAVSFGIAVYQMKFNRDSHSQYNKITKQEIN